MLSLFMQLISYRRSETFQLVVYAYTVSCWNMNFCNIKYQSLKYDYMNFIILFLPQPP